MAVIATAISYSVYYLTKLCMQVLGVLMVTFDWQALEYQMGVDLKYVSWGSGDKFVMIPGRSALL